MQPHDINATHRNKNFVVSIMQALEQLKTDEFVNLYLQADNQEVYKIKKFDNDPHTRLLREIAWNCRLFPVEKDHGELILQALYALPNISNTNKLLAMLLVGATLDYDDFKNRFGAGGELSPARNIISDVFDELTDVREAFSVGIDQSNDVRFLIDKMKAIEVVYSSRHIESFVGRLKYFNFTSSSFAEFYAASSDAHKNMIIHNAPKGLIQSDGIVDLVDNGFVPSKSDIEPSFLSIFQAGNIAAFMKLTKIVLAQSSYIRGYEAMGRFFSHHMQSGLTEGQLAIKNAFVQELNAYELETADRNPILFGDYAIQYLTRAFESGDIDQFSKLMTASRKTDEARQAFMPLFMDINDMVLRGLIITDDHKHMMSLLRDSVVEQMNNLIEHAQPTSPQQRDSRGRSRFDEYPGRGF